MGGIIFSHGEPELCFFMGQSTVWSMHLSPLVASFEETASLMTVGGKYCKWLLFKAFKSQWLHCEKTLQNGNVLPSPSTNSGSGELGKPASVC